MNVDVVVLGAGPAGVAAALSAAKRGATVALIEAEEVGGACVRSTCIPTALMMSAAAPVVELQELATLGVIDLDGGLRLGRAGARRDALVAQLGAAAVASLRAARVEVIRDHGRVAGPTSVMLRDKGEVVTAAAIVVATGTRWEAPEVAGVAPARILTADAVMRLSTAPTSAMVLAGGPAATAFTVESAFLLAVLGAQVTYASEGEQVIPALDADVDGYLRTCLETLGIAVAPSSVVRTGEGAYAFLADDVREIAAAADVVVGPDGRRANLADLGLAELGVVEDGFVAVDRFGRTAVPSILAAGDVVGGPMVTQAARAGGRLAGINAAGGELELRAGAVPHVLHISPPVGWVGLSEAAATAAGHAIDVAFVDMSSSARGVTLGGREGVIKVIADRELGGLLGVHVVGPDAAEVVSLAALAMHAELTVDEVAGSAQWHPSAAELLADACQAIADRGSP